MQPAPSSPLPPSCGPTDPGFHPNSKIIAGVFGVSIAGTIAFLMANPRKAQEVGGQYHPQAISKEEKFKQQRGH